MSAPAPPATPAPPDTLHARRRARRTRRNSGFSLVEAAAAIALLAVGAMAVLSSMTYALRLYGTNRETSEAMQAVRRQLELVKTQNIGDVVALYNADDTDDPGGEATAPGPTFDVPALSALSGSSDDAGTIVLPLSDSGELREDLVMPEIGMPRDLNGDGVIDDLDHRTDVLSLPVLVRVTWDGIDGERTVSYWTVLR